MKITDITPQKRSGRFNIFIDGRFYIGVSDRVIADHILYKDKEINNEELERIANDELYFKVYDLCIAKIARRPNSIHEVELYIRQTFYKKKNDWMPGLDPELQKKLQESISVEVIEKLKALKLLSDENFVNWLVENRTEFSPRGYAAIHQELSAKGVSQELINNVKFPREVELKLAEEVYQKAFHTEKPSRDKAIRRLASRGFGWETIESILSKHELD